METSPNITVGILKSKEIKFYLSGKYKVAEIETPLFGNFQAKIDGNRIKLSSDLIELEFTNEAVLLPCTISSDNFELKDVTIGIDFHWEQKENQKFQGALKLLACNGEIDVINIIPIENYLASVISSEMNANSSLELLKAHSIISRSWVLAQIEKHKNPIYKDDFPKSTNDAGKVNTDEFITWYDRENHENYIVCADDHCQRYQGITRSHNTKVITAIQETNGQVLMFDGKICDARYSKSCGGVTEKYNNCWEPVDLPYLTRVVDADESLNKKLDDLTIEENAVQFIQSKPEVFCNTHDKKILSQVLNDYDVKTENFFRWEVAYSQTEIAKLVKNKSGIDFGDIIDLIPIERGDSGRLIKLKIVGSKKVLTIGKELEIRKWLSKSHLFSSAFYIEKQKVKNKKPEKFILKGSGWGHGVGLCQIGAAVMGEKGYNYTQILNHYYKGAIIEKNY